MAGAYTPGLTVSGDVVVRRLRRLPIKGDVLVSVGQEVTPETVVARAYLQGPLQTVKLAERLGVEPKDAPGLSNFQVGAEIKKGDTISESKGFLGMFKQLIVSDFSGTVESISTVTGNILIREPSVPVDINAYIEGKVAEVIPEEGAIIETEGAMVQGIFGVGGERMGTIKVAVSAPDSILTPEQISEQDRGKILVSGKGIGAAAIRKAFSCGVIGIVTGGIKDADLIEILGYDIGVAITGQENIPCTIIVTEGFGNLAMAARTFELLKHLEGSSASINGATQIRAGVIRPEVIAPLAADRRKSAASTEAGLLDIGTPIRIIREPYFGALGKVKELPAQLVVVDSGTEVRVLRAELDRGEVVTVPRANVEIIAN